ncbi:MAG: hypothetical protein LHV68_00650 [Elusimicrobia bacterium]|nr:hypothetical protein [Candidatus Liberimonas magnetica]
MLFKRLPESFLLFVGFLSFLFPMAGCKDKKPIIVKPVDKSLLFSKVRGELLISKAGLLIINNLSGNFVLEGNKDGLKELAGKDVSVFGKMKVKNPASVDGKEIKYNIEISTFSTGELKIGEDFNKDN